MPKKSRQISMLAKERSAYGGDLLKTREGRRRGRPLSTTSTMHLVLRSSKAKGEWSFRRPRNEAHVNRIVDKFSVIYGVRVISMANVGNHLHLQIKLSNRFGYKPFIRAVTSAIAMAVTGRNRWSEARLEKSGRLQDEPQREKTGAIKNDVTVGVSKEKFWDYRPFTRVVEGFKAWLKLKDYIRINELEASGLASGPDKQDRRENARFMLKVERGFA